MNSSYICSELAIANSKYSGRYRKSHFKRICMFQKVEFQENKKSNIDDFS